MEKLLVTGVDGVVGANLAVTLAEWFEVTGVSAREVQLDDCRTLTCPYDATELAGAVGECSPRWIIHCGPLAGSSWDDPTGDPAGEAELASALAAACEDRGSYLTVISTDAVFSGPRVYHREDSPPSLNGPLAAAALAMEERLCPPDGPRALVARTHAYGWGPRSESADYAQRAWQSLFDGTYPPADVWRHATPILASDLARPLRKAYDLGLTGLLHVAGAERTSPRRFVAELAATFSLAAPRRRLETPPPAPEEMRETSLICRRAVEQLQVAPPMLREGLARFAAQLTNGHRERLGAESKRKVKTAA